MGRVAWSACTADLAPSPHLTSTLVKADPDPAFAVVGATGAGTTTRVACEWLQLSVCSYDCRPCGGSYLTFGNTTAVPAAAVVSNFMVMQVSGAGEPLATIWHPNFAKQAQLACDAIAPPLPTCPAQIQCDAGSSGGGCSARPTRPPEGYEAVEDGETPIAPQSFDPELYEETYREFYLENEAELEPGG